MFDMSNALVLPFYTSIEQISYNHPALYNVRSREFRLITKADELLPFICPLPDPFTGNFSIVIREWWTKKAVTTINPVQIAYTIVKIGGKRYLLYKGGRVGCINLGCGPYFLQIGNYFSEVFYGENNVGRFTKFTLGNTKDIQGVPYSLFDQYFYVDGPIANPEFDTFQISSRDERGNLSVSYSKQTANYGFSFREVPPHMQGVFSSLHLLDDVRITDQYNTVQIIPNASIVRTSNKVNWWATVDLTLPDSNEVDSNYCDANEVTIDTDFLGNTNPVTCIPNDGIDDIIVVCENPIDYLETSCEVLQFMAVIII